MSPRLNISDFKAIHTGTDYHKKNQPISKMISVPFIKL